MCACSFRCVCALALATSAGAASGQVVVQPGTPRAVVVQPGVVMHPQVTTVPVYRPYAPSYQPWHLYPPYVVDYRRRDVHPPYPPPCVPDWWWNVYRPHPPYPYPVPKSFCMPLRASFLVPSAAASYQPVVSSGWPSTAPVVLPQAPVYFPAAVVPSYPVAVGGVVYDPRTGYAAYPVAGSTPVYLHGGVPVGVWPGTTAGAYVAPAGATRGGVVVYPGPSGFIPWIPPGYRLP